MSMRLILFRLVHHEIHVLCTVFQLCSSVHGHVHEVEWAKYMSMQCDACAHMYMYTHVQCMCADTGEESTALVFNVDSFFI